MKRYLIDLRPNQEPELLEVRCGALSKAEVREIAGGDFCTVQGTRPGMILILCGEEPAGINYIATDLLPISDGSVPIHGRVLVAIERLRGVSGMEYAYARHWVDRLTPAREAAV